MKYALESKYTFKTPNQAEYVLRSLLLDFELRKDVTKVMKTDGCELLFKFSSDSLKQLKISHNKFLDFLELAINTVEIYDPNH